MDVFKIILEETFKISCPKTLLKHADTLTESLLETLGSSFVVSLKREKNNKNPPNSHKKKMKKNVRKRKNMLQNTRVETLIWSRRPSGSLSAVTLLFIVLIRHLASNQSPVSFPASSHHLILSSFFPPLPPFVSRPLTAPC